MHSPRVSQPINGKMNANDADSVSILLIDLMAKNPNGVNSTGDFMSMPDMMMPGSMSMQMPMGCPRMNRGNHMGAGYTSSPSRMYGFGGLPVTMRSGMNDYRAMEDDIFSSSNFDNEQRMAMPSMSMRMQSMRSPRMNGDIQMKPLSIGLGNRMGTGYASSPSRMYGFGGLPVTMRSGMNDWRAMEDDIFSSSNFINQQRMAMRMPSMRNPRMNGDIQMKPLSTGFGNRMDTGYVSSPSRMCGIGGFPATMRSGMNDWRAMEDDIFSSSNLDNLDLAMGMNPRSVSMGMSPMKSDINRSLASMGLSPMKSTGINRSLASMGVSPVKTMRMRMCVDPMRMGSMNSMGMSPMKSMDINRSLASMGVSPMKSMDINRSLVSMGMSPMKSMGMSPMKSMGMNRMNMNRMDVNRMAMNMNRPLMCSMRSNLRNSLKEMQNVGDGMPKTMPCDMDIMEEIFWNSLWDASEDQIEKAYKKVENLKEYINLVEAERKKNPMAKSDISDALYRVMKRTLMHEMVKLDASKKINKIVTKEHGKTMSGMPLSKL